MKMRNLPLALFSHRTLALLRWDLHFLGVRLGNWLARRNPGRMLVRKGPVYLNLGSGPRGLADSHWINVDGYSDVNVHYCMDLNRRFPFSANAFDGIFCEHVFEHFDLEHGLVLMRECLRVLRSGACIRIVVPDAEKIIRTYFDSPSELMRRRPGQTSCAMEAVDSYLRQRYEHQCLYDWPLLEHQLRQAGFDPVLRAAYKQGKISKAIILDDEKYEWESLYVEALKPPHGN
jgi:predicted SAM-dependent methyltransferase